MFLLITPLIFSGFSSAAIECYRPQDCDDGIFYTKDVCKNPGTNYSYCVHEIKDPVTYLLDKILGKLIELVNKGWVIDVQPNVTVTPEVIVNPNITLPEINIANEMPKRGNIIIKEPTYSYHPSSPNYLWGELQMLQFM